MNPFSQKLHFLPEVLREAFFPLGCALCGKELHKNTESFYGLCGACRESLTIPNAEYGRCFCCGQPLLSEKETCLPCRNGPERSFDRLVSLFPYMGKYQKLLSNYKFKKRLGLGNFFVEKLWEGLDLLFSGLNFTLFSEAPVSQFCWVPVPARPGKIKHKGWDQIDYLSKLFENNIPYHYKKLSISINRCLKRLPSKTQKELNKENRLQNLKGRIVITNTKFLTVPKTAVLFDDVYTTGATMDACAAALKSAGTEQVYGVCLFYD